MIKELRMIVVYDPKDHRILVMCRDGYAASYEDGIWFGYIRFDAEDQYENFFRLKDEKSCNLILQMSKIALR